MRVTRHADGCMRERVGVPRRAVEKLARKALTDGLTRHDFHGPLRRYLDALYHYNRSAVNIRVWSEKVYIFSDRNVLITVLDLPNKYKSRANSAAKKGESDALDDGTE